MYNLLFVCTGNICRSSTAEAVFRHYVQQKDLSSHFYADSAGIQGYHTGSAPDHRSVRSARDNGVIMEGQKARKVTKADFEEFNLILAMDRGHYAYLRDLAPAAAGAGGKVAELSLFLDYHKDYKGQDVPDPYYGSQMEFEKTYLMIAEGVDGLINYLVKDLGL